LISDNLKLLLHHRRSKQGFDADICGFVMVPHFNNKATKNAYSKRKEVIMWVVSLSSKRDPNIIIGSRRKILIYERFFISLPPEHAQFSSDHLLRRRTTNRADTFRVGGAVSF